METIRKSASVKVMLSYDYCHFEVAMAVENEGGLTQKDIDNARKDCQRLADKAVGQYKTMKAAAAKRADGEYQMQNFDSECKRILAMLKQYQDENWRAKFVYAYDYDDDENYDY